MMTSNDIVAAGLKKDAKGIMHIWGIITTSGVIDSFGYTNDEKYIFWGRLNKSLYLRNLSHVTNYRTYSMITNINRIWREKQKDGYRAITKDQLINRWPTFNQELEMIQVVRKLKYNE